MKLSTLSAALASALFASVIAYADPNSPQAHEADGIAAVMAQLENPPESVEHKAGVAKLQQLAEAGNPRAMIRLGERLEKGPGVDDFEYALAYYRRAVEAGYEPARSKIAAAYLNRGLRHGPGTALGRQNLTAAVREYTQLAEQNDPDGLWNLGYLLVSGYGIDRDFPLGHAYIEQASRGGVAGASLWLASFYRANPGGGDPEQLHIEHLQRAAGQGSHMARALLEDAGGLELSPLPASTAPAAPVAQALPPEPAATPAEGFVSISTPPPELPAATAPPASDAVSSAQLTTQLQELDRTRRELRLAEQRIAQLEAQVQSYRVDLADAGTLNKQGLQAVMANDYELAASRFRKAAEMNHPGAIANLGTLHLNGTGVTRDGNQAVALFERAVEMGNVTAAENLGRTYHYGLGVRQSRSRAIRWYRTAQEMGSTHASQVLHTLVNN